MISVDKKSFDKICSLLNYQNNLYYNLFAMLLWCSTVCILMELWNIQSEVNTLLSNSNFFFLNTYNYIDSKMQNSTNINFIKW